jgi:dimethylamine--corrinoid protein Co-methyltransferase
MGGIKTAGDLVFRMQLLKGMRIGEAKKYVADKLGVTEFDLCDSSVMAEIRNDLGLGVQMPSDCAPTGISAKMRIERALDIRINSVGVFEKKAGINLGR